MDVNFDSYSDTFSVTEEVSIEFDLDDVIDNIPSEKMREHLEGIGELYGDTDELIRILIDGDNERDMLDAMDIDRVIDILGEDDLLSEIDDDTIKTYAVENGLVDDANLDDFGTEGLVDELMERQDLDAILSRIDSEFIQAHMIAKRGGFTLESVSEDDLRGALEERGHLCGFTLSSEVVHAVHVLDEFTNYILNSKGGLEGKRFKLPTE